MRSLCMSASGGITILKYRREGGTISYCLIPVLSDTIRYDTVLSDTMQYGTVRIAAQH